MWDGWLGGGRLRKNRGGKNREVMMWSDKIAVELGRDEGKKVVLLMILYQ